MSAALVTPRITVEEFAQRPERTDGSFEELLQGEVFVSPNVKPLHNDLSEYIYRSLIPLEGAGLYLVRGEVACRLSNESLPNTDACLVDRQTWLAALEKNLFYKGAPVLAVEIKSPGNTGRQMRVKSMLYLEHGAQQVWIVQPESRNVVVMTPEGDDRIIGREGILEFESLTIPVAGIFSA